MKKLQALRQCARRERLINRSLRRMSLTCRYGAYSLIRAKALIRVGNAKIRRNVVRLLWHLDKLSWEAQAEEQSAMQFVEDVVKSGRSPNGT